MSTSPKPKSVVLCFDGTAGQFSVENTNVVKFYGLLDKSCPDQVSYYQPGIGTYNPDTVSPAFELFAKALDLAIAWYLDGHVMGGYKFLMEHYRPGDKVSIFGFSRGAYTARALAGFLFKIGLLSRNNLEQVPLAYNHYTRSSDELAAKFKDTFCTPVAIDFLGVWDTVSSVGMIYGRTLPFTAANSAVRVFRHALSLDEHRARFQPNMYHHESPEGAARKVALGLEDPSDPLPSVLEVWFAGCHSDVGGGAVLDTVSSSLADITLAWMVEQVVQSDCGIKFNEAALLKAGITVPTIQITSEDGGNTTRRRGPRVETAEQVQLRQQDVRASVNDELAIHPVWWILEFVPAQFTWQEPDASWRTIWKLNLGRGREIRDPHPIFHESVKQKMECSRYKPKARWTPGKERYTDELR
jgi:hypothetical protein